MVTQSVGGERFVVHAPVGPLEIEEQAQRAECAVRDGIEHPHLDVGVAVQCQQHLVGSGTTNVVQQQPHPDAAIRRAATTVRPAAGPMRPVSRYNTACRECARRCRPGPGAPTTRPGHTATIPPPMILGAPLSPPVPVCAPKLCSLYPPGDAHSTLVVALAVKRSRSNRRRSATGRTTGTRTVLVATRTAATWSRIHA